MYKRQILQRLETIPIIQSKYNIFTHVEPINKINKNLLKGSTVNNPLSNTLCAVKDNIATNDMPTTCSSSMLSNYQSPFDATVVKLLRESGTTIVGKTNMDEFAMGSLGIHSHYGPALNPLFHDVDTVSGGSSSGSAGSVTSGVVHFALGTDTGGSVRLPACYCSVLGFKGSYGRISRFGVVSFAQSLDTVGIMAVSYTHLDVYKRQVLYGQDFCVASSVLPAFTKRGDVIVADDQVSLALQNALQLSRSTVYYFEHNNMESLENLLAELTDLEKKDKPPAIPRKFIVTEGLFENSGDIAPLPELVKLKEKYKFRLFVDENLSIGVLGATGRGLAEHYGMNRATAIDITIGSLATAIGSSGGFLSLIHI